MTLLSSCSDCGSSADMDYLVLNNMFIGSIPLCYECSEKRLVSSGIVREGKN